MAILEAKTNEVLPTGEYLVQLTDIEEIDGQFGEQFHMTFEIVKPVEHAGAQRQAWASVSTSLNSKILRWAAALYNRPIAAGEHVDTDALVGKRAVAVVISETRDDGSEYNKIDSLKAHAKQPVHPAPAGGGSTAKTDPFEDE